jgi:hypothetical protein
LNGCLIAHCVSMFPMVARLKLNYFRVNWKKLELQFPLQDLTLERLDLDVSPILNKTRKTEEKCMYFVLEITVNNEQSLYKVTLDHLIITRINYDDEHKACGKCIHVYLTLSKSPLILFIFL